MKIYFDANIWIDFLWSKRNKVKVRKQIGELIDCVKKEKYTVVTSVFLFTEISSFFTDWFILRRIVRRGFGYRELSSLKKQKEYNFLTSRQSKQINSLLELIADLEWVDSVELKNLNSEAIDLFSALTLQYFLDFADAFHVLIALNEGCDCIVTKDDPMRDKVIAFIDDYDLKREFTICRPKEFIFKQISNIVK